MAVPGQHEPRDPYTAERSNAIKFTDEGEIEVSVSSDAGRADLLRFEVRDTGVGISDAGRERLFESFAQADASTTRRYGGTGLGLAISKRLAEMMGGDIGVDSVVGAGSTFWFTARLTARPELAPVVVERESLGGVSALIVDDNATNRAILDRQLSACGIATTLAPDAATALDLLGRAAAEASLPDVALLDRHMPGVDGLQLVHMISGRADLDPLRIILLTSGVSSRSETAVRVAAYLTKPVRRSELMATLADVLGVGRRPVRRSGTGPPPTLLRPRISHRTARGPGSSWPRTMPSTRRWPRRC